MVDMISSYPPCVLGDLFMKVRNLTEGSPLKLLLAVAFPLMIGNVFQQMYTVIDAQVLGQAEGYETLAALGTCDWLNWLFFGLVQGLTMGFTIPMAQAFGANDEKTLKRSVGNSTILGLIISVALALIASIVIFAFPALSALSLRYLSSSIVTVLISTTSGSFETVFTSNAAFPLKASGRCTVLPSINEYSVSKEVCNILSYSTLTTSLMSSLSYTVPWERMIYVSFSTVSGIILCDGMTSIILSIILIELPFPDTESAENE